MTVEDVIRCAPFRLPSPRNLTGYEWTVVRNALASGYQSSGRLPPPGLLDAMVAAIANQQQCPAWRQSSFGPAPAVAPFAYRCLGDWFGRLDAVSQGRALADIPRGLLCGVVSPGAFSCPETLGYVGSSRRDLWEGSVQQGTISPGVSVEACAYSRDRTAYITMKGAEMLELFKSVGGRLPPELEQAAQFGAQFLDRDMLVGVELRTPDLNALPGLLASQDLLAVARAAIAEIALVWAPGRGASVRWLLDGQVDGARIMGLLQAMMPDLLPQILPGLPQILPQLLPNLLQLPWWQPMLASSGAVMNELAGGLSSFGAFGATTTPIPQPGTPPTTDSDVVDKPGGSLPTGAPPIPGLEALTTDRGTALVLGAVAAVLVTTLLFRLARG